MRRLVRRLVRGKKPSVIFNLSKTIRVVVKVGKQHPLLVVRAAQDLVLIEIELITNTEPASLQVRSCSPEIFEAVPHTLPVSALLAGEALQMVDVGPGPHHHLEGRDDFVAGGAVAGGAEQPEVFSQQASSPSLRDQPEIISLTEQEVPLGVERVAHLAQPGVTAAALETVLVPEHVQSLQPHNVSPAQQHNGYCSKCLKNMRFLMS